MSKNVFDIITVGDSTIDTFIKIHDASVACDLNNKECKICIKYGSKIPVESMAHGVAGNAANVAVACSNLGLKTAIYTNLGSDKHGELIKNALVNKGVSPDYIVESKDKSSNLSVVLTFQNERTIFVYHQDWYYHLPDNIAAASWVYLTSMAETFTNSNIMDEVCRYVDRNEAKLAYSPGTYQLKAGISKYPKILDRCELLVVNFEEAHMILGIELAEKTAIRDLLSKLLLLGPKTVVITDAEKGSYASDGKEYLHVGIFPTQVVEKTGAGDAYAGAFIAAVSSGQSLGEAMVWGTLNSSHAISQIGAQNGLMTREEITRYRSSAPEFVASSL